MTVIVTLKILPKEEGEVAPQARVLLETLKKLRGTAELAALAKAAKPHLETVQPVERIFAHYQKALVKAGFITTKKQ